MLSELPTRFDIVSHTRLRYCNVWLVDELYLYDRLSLRRKRGRKVIEELSNRSGRMAVESRIAVAHHNLMAKGGAEGVGMNVIEALQYQYDVTILTLERPNIGELNEFYNTAVDEQAIDVRQIGWVIPALYERTIGRIHLMKHALVSRLMARHADDFELVFCTYDELSLPDRSLQYIHYPRFRRWMNNDDRGPLYSIYDEVSKAIEGFDAGLISTSRLLANSEWTAGVTEETYGTRPEVVYPPVDTTEFVDTPWAEREDGFVTIGRLIPQKNVLRSIEVIERLNDRNSDIHLHVIGSPRHTDYTKRVEAAAATHDFVHLEGNVNRTELVELISSHRYGIHGMDHEHFGMAVAELAAGGTIPFVPNGGGQREIVHEREKLLYETADEAVEKIDHVLSNPELRTELRNELNDIEERFGRARFKRTIRELVAEELNESEPTARTAP